MNIGEFTEAIDATVRQIQACYDWHAQFGAWGSSNSWINLVHADHEIVLTAVEVNDAILALTSLGHAVSWRNIDEATGRETVDRGNAVGFIPPALAGSGPTVSMVMARQDNGLVFVPYPNVIGFSIADAA